MINHQDFHILLAEDDVNLNSQFFNQLKEKGFHIFPIYDGFQLYQVGSMKNVRENENLVIVSDTDMPQMDGDEACKKLLQKFPDEYKRKIIIGMSDNTQNEEYWKDIGVWQTFIYKGHEIANPNSGKNLAELVFNRINKIKANPRFYVLPDRSLKRCLYQ